MIFIRSLLLLACFFVAQAAEIIEYNDGETLVVATKVNPDPTTTDYIRTVVLLGVQKMQIKGTWKPEELDIIQNGNGIRFALRANKDIPVDAVADNGVIYHLTIHPVAIETPLDPEVRVIRKAATSGNGVVSLDPRERAGGHWEHETNSWIRLHKHIRGGRQIPNVQGHPLWNEDILRNEGRRVAGKRRSENDEWRVYDYYEWTLMGVRGTFMGVTYTGRREAIDFEYLRQKTESALSIWHYPRQGDTALYNRKFPGIPMQRGREEFFLLYERIDEVSP